MQEQPTSLLIKCIRNIYKYDVGFIERNLNCNENSISAVNEEIYNVYCHLSRQITKCPDSWANVIDKYRQYNFVLDGEDINDQIKEELRTSPRPLTFCQYALNSTSPLIANDLTKHKIFKNHPSVLKIDGPRFYAAFPLINSEGYILGSLCVRDFRVRRLSKNIINF